MKSFMGRPMISLQTPNEFYPFASILHTATIYFLPEGMRFDWAYEMLSL